MQLTLTHIGEISDYCKENFNIPVHRFNEISLLARLQSFFLQIDDLEQFFRKCENEQFLSNFQLACLPFAPEMFRNPFMWWDLKDKVISEIVKKKKNINIWMPHCVAGEDIYSLVILLKEMGLDNYTIYADEMIKGTVGSFIMRGDIHALYHHVNLANYQRMGGQNVNMDHYFITSLGEKFFNKNLLSNLIIAEQYVPAENIDLVFFTNKLINYKHEYKLACIDHITGAIHDGCYMILGEQENLLTKENRKKYKIISDENKIFVKR